MGKPGKYNEREIEYEFLFRNLQRSRGPNLLDVGPGDAGTALTFVQCGYAVTSIDPKPAHSWVKKGDVRKLKYKNECFDVVTCISTLEHIPSPEKAAKEMLRVLKKGGVLIISHPYNSKTHFENVYVPKYRVAVFNDQDLQNWFGNMTLKDTAYWRQWTGKYWRSGAKMKRAAKTDKGGAQGICQALIK